MLDNAIAETLGNETMHRKELAANLNNRSLYQRKDGLKVPVNQVNARMSKDPDRFISMGRGRWRLKPKEDPYDPSKEASELITGDVLGSSGKAAIISAAFQVATVVTQGVCEGHRPTTIAAKAATEGTKAALQSGAKTAVSIGLRKGAYQLAERAGRESIKKLVRGNAATVLIFAGIEQAVETVRLARGLIAAEDYAQRTRSNAASTGGTMGGAAIGTMICPGPGTLIGGLVGTLAGSKAAGWFGKGVTARPVPRASLKVPRGNPSATPTPTTNPGSNSPAENEPLPTVG